jgi:hypothetical protein
MIPKEFIKLSKIGNSFLKLTSSGELILEQEIICKSRWLVEAHRVLKYWLNKANLKNFVEAPRGLLGHFFERENPHYRIFSLIEPMKRFRLRNLTYKDIQKLYYLDMAVFNRNLVYSYLEKEHRKFKNRDRILEVLRLWKDKDASTLTNI